MGRNGLRAVLFDGDDTLFTVHEAQRAALRLVLEELWSRVPRSVEAGYDVDGLIDVGHRVACELVDRVLDVTAVQLAAFERLLEDAGQPDPELASELTGSYFSHLERLVGVADGAHQVVDELAKVYRLALVSRVDPTRWGMTAFSVVVATSVSTVITDVGTLDLVAVGSALDSLEIAPNAVVLVSRSERSLALATSVYDLVPARIGGSESHNAAGGGLAVASLADLGKCLIDAEWETSGKAPA